ncbi:MAG: hypothetical protein QOE96_1530 [Blastocatellia bacterium]|jgi:hypothetical protein|nr:hypothetical protein [Blastocatellia bacterium]
MRRKLAALQIFLFTIVFLAVAGVSITQGQATPQSTVSVSSPSPTSAPLPASTPSPIPSPAAQPKVTGYQGHLELDNVIQVEIVNLAEWAKTNDVSKLVPYLNGRAIRGDYPEEIHVSKNHVHFHLHITPENRDAWVDLLGEPPGTVRPVAFSIGLENHSPFDSVFDQNNRIPLTVISPFYGVVALIVVLVTLALFVWLARTTNLIREPGDCPVPGKLRPYNLGRTQMAFWFFLIYVSYLVIWLVTDALDTITPSLLGLMGISAGTALGEALIDSGKETTNENQRRDLTAEKQSLEQSIPALQTQLDSLNAKAALTPEDLSNRDSLNQQIQDARTRLAQVNQQIPAATPLGSAGVSRGLIADILSDSSGYSFHRFQIFAWTIVLGIMFMSAVYNNLTMPEFSATLLGLMGISSGTYIGFKFPEKK